MKSKKKQHLEKNVNKKQKKCKEQEKINLKTKKKIRKLVYRA